MIAGKQLIEQAIERTIVDVAKAKEGVEKEQAQIRLDMLRELLPEKRRAA